MTIQRLTLANIETEILRAAGYSSSTLADWKTQANLVSIINRYVHSIPARIAAILKSPVPMYQDMWRSTGTLSCTSGSSTAYLPADCDAVISLWDSTNSRPVYLIEDGDVEIERYRLKPAGPPERVEVLGYATNVATWQKKCTIWPATMTGVTPSIAVKYYRIPASGTAGDYVDADPRYDSLWVAGVACEVLAPTNPSYDRYKAQEQELLADLALHSRPL